MRLLPVLLLVACASGVQPVVDASRPEHYFDHPFPSDELVRADGTVDLTGFPEPTGEGLLVEVVRGWKIRNDMSSQGFANNGSFYFRFAEALEDVPETTEGLPEDPVLLVDMDTGELYPLELRFVTDPLDDPFFAENLLAGVAVIGHPPRSGAHLAAVVMKSAGVKPTELPEGVEDALDLAGVRSKAAVATTWHVSDATDMLQQLFDAADAWVGADPDYSGMVWERVTSLDINQGTTQSGKDTTIVTANFESGGSEQAFCYALEGPAGEHSHDFSTWRMAVYQSYLQVPYFQDLEDRPFMSPGVGHLSDTDVFTGWIDFEAGQLASEPVADSTRVVLQVPLDDNGDPAPIRGVMVWDHGTAGHAYNAVQRVNGNDRGRELAAEYAAAGFAVISHDAPLYGTRYPLIDEGFTDGSLGFYNIVNVPAFRDNQRQTGVESHVVRRFAEHLPELFPDLPWASELVFVKGGHSLGSVTTHNAASAAPDEYVAVLGSGSGGVFSDYILHTGLLANPNGLASLLLPLLGFDAEDDPEVGEIVAASIGIEEDEARLRIDRKHPAIMLFQWGMDPSDPMALARSEEVPVTLLTGIGDYQVPNHTSHALANALPDAVVVECTPTSDSYDPHQCMYREDEGIAIVRDWLANLP
ncbi:MAG: hypothetical protein EP330_30530 [Deltaproteobacteria bacterium]|nr:MAG: hypothetical protein EP330_30530 [Deltaproteobacteria bacterium]